MEEVAQVYSRSLFEVAKERDRIDETREELGEIAEALSEKSDLATFFFSPYFSTQEKKEGLGKTISGADETLVNFLELLLENHRMPLIHRIHRQYEELWREENRLLQVQVTSAIELDKQTVDSIGEKIGEQTGRRIDLQSKVDPDILGGIVLRVGNAILDASIRSRLDQLRRQVARA